MPDFPTVDLNEIGAEGNPLVPYDPFCKRYASEMSELDLTIFESEEDYEAAGGEATAEQRNEFVIREEGTYNHLNGHFTCMRCYIKIGMPSGPNGWRCP